MHSDDGKDPVVLRDRLRSFLGDKDSFSGCELCVAQLAGSHAFNLNVATSDEDFFGVFFAPGDVLLAGDKRKESLCSHDPDYETHSLENFLLLLEKGNPKVIEPMFTSHLIWKDARVLPLFEAAKKVVLSQHTLKQYRHYAKSQKGDAEETPSKKRYHALRIAKEGQRIARGGEPLVFLTGAERDAVYRYRLDPTLPEAEFLADFEAAIAECSNETLPPDTNVDFVEPLLVNVRRQRMQVVPSAFAQEERPAMPEAVNAVLGQHFAEFQVHLVSERLVLFAGDVRNTLGFARNRIVALDDAGAVLKAPNAKYGGQRFVEVAFFCSLLASGDYRMLEVLFLDDYEYCSSWAQFVRENRAQFCAKQAIENTFGNAKGRLAAKDYASCARLVSYCEAFCEGATLIRPREPVAALSEEELRAKLSALEASRKKSPGFKNMQEARDWIREHLLVLRRGNLK